MNILAYWFENRCKSNIACNLDYLAVIDQKCLLSQKIDHYHHGGAFVTPLNVQSTQGMLL